MSMSAFRSRPTANYRFAFTATIHHHICYQCLLQQKQLNLLQYIQQHIRQLYSRRKRITLPLCALLSMLLESKDINIQHLASVASFSLMHQHQDQQ